MGVDWSGAFDGDGKPSASCAFDGEVEPAAAAAP